MASDPAPYTLHTTPYTFLLYERGPLGRHPVVVAEDWLEDPRTLRAIECIKAWGNGTFQLGDCEGIKYVEAIKKDEQWIRDAMTPDNQFYESKADEEEMIESLQEMVRNDEDAVTCMFYLVSEATAEEMFEGESFMHQPLERAIFIWRAWWGLRYQGESRVKEFTHEAFCNLDKKVQEAYFESLPVGCVLLTNDDCDFIYKQMMQVIQTCRREHYTRQRKHSLLKQLEPRLTSGEKDHGIADIDDINDARRTRQRR